MRTRANPKSGPFPAALLDLVFWLIVAAVALGVGAMMWWTATLGT